MSEPFVFLNGKILPQARGALPFHDAGFVMGATVTDLCRTVNGRLYRWEDHLERFQASCALGELTLPHPANYIAWWAEILISANGALLRVGEDLALVLFLTPGPIGYYHGEPGGAGDAPPTFGMHTFPLPFQRYRPLIEKGASLRIPSVRQVSAHTVDPRIKQRSRLHWWLAEREVRRVEPGALALLLNEAGHITETAAANILFVRDGTVFSSPTGTVLEGVSLKVIGELCQELGVPFIRQELTPADLQEADEILLTSTTYCLAWVSHCEGRVLPGPGPMFRLLADRWNEHLGLDAQAQILAFSV